MAAVRNRWTTKEIAVIRNMYGEGMDRLVDLLPRHTRNSIKSKCSELGFNVPPSKNLWTVKEIELLKRHHTEGIHALEEALPRHTKHSIKDRLRKEGLRTTDMKMWSQAEDDILRKYVTKNGFDWDRIMDELPGRTMRAVRFRAHKLGLRTSRSAWTDDEVKVLIENEGANTKEMAALIPTHTPKSIREKARILGINVRKAN